MGHNPALPQEFLQAGGADFVNCYGHVRIFGPKMHYTRKA